MDGLARNARDARGLAVKVDLRLVPTPTDTGDRGGRRPKRGKDAAEAAAAV